MGSTLGHLNGLHFTVKFDGTELTKQKFLGGHPEWSEGDTVIGSIEPNQVLYDVVQQKVVGQIGESGTFANPEGDVSFSPNAELFVNGSSVGTITVYTVYRLKDDTFVRSREFDRGPFTSKLTTDPAPRWNRWSNQILVPDWVDSFRQLFIITVEGAPVDSYLDSTYLE